MKKNVARIQKWLDRMSSACEGKKWDSALIEADCLSAEVRKTREEILDSARCEREAKPKYVGGRRLFVAVRTASVAFVIVLAASLPSALEADKPWQPAVKTVYVKEDRLSWVTPEEEELLLSLRSEISRSELVMAGAAARTQANAPKGTVYGNARSSVTVKKEAVSDGSETATLEKRIANGVTNEDLATLVQIGEKALRGSSPAIKVID